MKRTLSVFLMALLPMLALTTFTSCSDDNEEDELYVSVNGSKYNLVGLYAYGWEESDFKRVDVLYSLKKDGTAIAYTNYTGYPLVNGIMQCKFSDFREELRATWSMGKGSNTISLAGFAITITKIHSNDEVEAINWWGDEIIIRRVKGFAKDGKETGKNDASDAE